MEAKSIKETKELLTGVKQVFKLAKGVRDILADGVDAGDLPATFTLIKDQADQIDVYDAAIKDVKLVKEEITDLEKEEIMELLFIVIDGISEVEEA
jgi:hypothetical protein